LVDQQRRHDESVDPASELQRLVRLLTKGAASESRDDKAHVPSYGNLAAKPAHGFEAPARELHDEFEAMKILHADEKLLLGEY
jgi:hypothetical protein